MTFRYFHAFLFDYPCGLAQPFGLILAGDFDLFLDPVLGTLTWVLWTFSFSQFIAGQKKTFQSPESFF